VSVVSVAAEDQGGQAVELLGDLSASEWVRLPRQARSEETLTRFLEATAELIAGRRFDEISVNEICSRAGRTVGSFYARFDDKSSVLRVLVEQVADRLRLEAEAYWVPENFAGESIEEVIGRTVDAVLGAYREAGAVFHAAAIDAPNDSSFRDARLGVWITCAEGFGEVLLDHEDQITHPDPRRAGQLAMMAVISLVDVRMIYGDQTRPLCHDEADLRLDLLSLMRSLLNPGQPEITSESRAG
jgi:AcrR family transcriptional regulator